MSIPLVSAKTKGGDGSDVLKGEAEGSKQGRADVTSQFIVGEKNGIKVTLIKL